MISIVSIWLCMYSYRIFMEFLQYDSEKTMYLRNKIYNFTNTYVVHNTII